MATKQNSVVYAARGWSALREEMPSLACGGEAGCRRGPVAGFGHGGTVGRWNTQRGTPFFVRAPDSLGHARRQRTLRA